MKTLQDLFTGSQHPALAINNRKSSFCYTRHTFTHPPS